MKTIDNPKLAIPRAWFELTCAASKTHSRYAALAFALHGDHGPLISGCVRDHFPPDVKDALRQLAREVTELSGRAWAARPPRIRLTTMRRLGQEVATRDGSGYYGPQPLR